MVKVRFMTLSDTFAQHKEETFKTEAEALEAVKAYAEAAGYTKVKVVDDIENYQALRYTARTPGGRHGRNVAFGDCYDEQDPFDGY